MPMHASTFTEVSVDRTEYITLGEAAELAPGRPSANCIWRWCRKGVLSRGRQRVRLRHVRIGGKIFTKAEWLNEFGQSLAASTSCFACPDRRRHWCPPDACRQDRSPYWDAARLRAFR